MRICQCAPTDVTVASALHRFLRETAKPRDVTIPQKSFEKLVKGLVAEWAPGIKFQAPVIGALQEAAEAMLVGRFEGMSAASWHWLLHWLLQY